MSVTVTETAAREVVQIVRQQELDPAIVRLRVGVKGGGCSGFSYLLDLTETTKDSDEVWTYDYDVPVAEGEGNESFSLSVIPPTEPGALKDADAEIVDWFAESSMPGQR